MFQVVITSQYSLESAVCCTGLPVVDIWIDSRSIDFVRHKIQEAPSLMDALSILLLL